MRAKRVLVTGATGFIGSRLCEVLYLTGSIEPRAFVHSTGAAARIARYPIDLALGDLCDARCVERAMQDCDMVVHLARGTDDVMRRGMENVLRAAVHHRISRLVHMSSVAVYGNTPPPQSVSEDAPARRSNLPYGNLKLQQETQVCRYVRKYRLPAVILRPPNVYGPFSSFTTGLFSKIRDGKMAVVDGGQNPCNLVYVDNLVYAVLLALWRPEAAGQIFFVQDKETITWKQCLYDHAAMIGARIPEIDSGQLARPRPEKLLRDSLRALPKVVTSAEFRGALRGIPVIRRIELYIYKRFQSLQPETRDAIRYRLQGPESDPSNGSALPAFSASDNIIAAQFRRVAHSSSKAARLLGYTPPVSYEEGIKLTQEWLRYSRMVN